MNMRARYRACAKIFARSYADVAALFSRVAQESLPPSGLTVPAQQIMITAVLGLTDAELRARVALVIPNKNMRKHSGLPPVASFMPYGLLDRIDKHIRDELNYEQRGASQSAIACVVSDMLFGTARPLPRV